MPSTYTPIATQTLTGTATAITFSSIPSSYTDLVLIGVGTASAQIDLNFTFNSDTASNYSRTYIYGTGSATGSGRDSSGTYVAVGGLNTSQCNFVTNIMNYSNTTTYKTILERANQPQAVTNSIVGLWRSTSAISTITMTTSSGTVSAGSTFTLYGILKA